jgi:hypothetical protein
LETSCIELIHQSLYAKEYSTLLSKSLKAKRTVASPFCIALMQQ